MLRGLSPPDTYRGSIAERLRRGPVIEESLGFCTRRDAFSGSPALAVDPSAYCVHLPCGSAQVHHLASSIFAAVAGGRRLVLLGVLFGRHGGNGDHGGEALVPNPW